VAEPAKKMTAIPAHESDCPQLSRSEGLALLESMKGMWSGQLERYGSVDEFVRKLRSDTESLLP
jgi:hypothetical protein